MDSKDLYPIGIASLEHDHTLDAAHRLNMSLSGYSERAIEVLAFARQNNLGPDTGLIALNGSTIGMPRITDEAVGFSRDHDAYVRLGKRITKLVTESGIPLDAYQRRSWRLTNYVLLNAGMHPVFIKHTKHLGDQRLQLII